MADHIDGPRTMGDPAIDLSDLFLFSSPENSARTVLVANAFPSAGETAFFSNAANYSVVVRRIRVAGMGSNARFEPIEPEIRFTFYFELLKSGMKDESPRQTGVCTLPDGRTLPVIVNDEQGSSTPDGVFRVFAGLRSDPFFVGWLPTDPLKSIPNLLQEDNVLTLLIEFETAQVLDAKNGSLFGVIAETTPRITPHDAVHTTRFDWIGRPEQTNFRLDGVPGSPDIRDLWNQTTPFELSDELRPIFQKQLTLSFERWDMKDGKADWPPAELAANVNVFLDDFLLFDITKPITDKSHLEIEKNTIEGRAYATGGGRTLDANVIDILVTWLTNHNQGAFLQGGALGPTQPGGRTFPYVCPPNKTLLTVTHTVDLVASPVAVWDVIGRFDALWHPMMATLHATGQGVGQLREILTIDGKRIIERLEEINNATRNLRYSLVSGIHATHYEGNLEVRPKGTGSSVTWRVNYRPDGQPEVLLHALLNALVTSGLNSLKTRFGVTQ